MGALAQRAEQFHTRLRLKGKESKITSESSSSMEPANDMSSTASTDFGRQLSSISSSSGSVGHPELCRRPCMYFNLGKCVNGSNFEYCHFPHDQRTMHLDKRQRDVLSKIPHEQFLALILHYLEAKAEENGFKAAAKELLQLLRGFAHLGTDEPVALPQLPRKMWAKLDYMLSKMTFQSLVSLAMKSKTGSDFADSISDAMSRMRQSLQN
ncbi:C3H1-type domain-containing protein [Durusdinium trenchii]|uniref:C3H1-type domain-containing protein n=1 Tax=Durusdinium trenchii TaxID=1381693 RepID=A0ABP0R6G1_9DINO